MDNEILVADEIAELLRVDRQRIYELVRQNRLPVIKLGERQYRFSAKAVLRFVERGGNVKGGEENEKR